MEEQETSTRRKDSPKELADEVDTPGNIFVLSDEEQEARVFHLRYNAKEDVYYRYGSMEPAVKGWKEGAFTVVNMQRYHARKGPENGEWAYLTRKPRHCSGSISWFIDLANTGLVVDQVYALTFSRTLSGGNISYDLRRPETPSSKHKSGSKINGLIFAAYLDGGLRKRERAQTQLFFQDCIDDPNGFPFDLFMTLKLSESKVIHTKNSAPLSIHGPLPQLSFPPRPHLLRRQSPCTCPKNHRENTNSASSTDVRDRTKCYAQDEKEILTSENPENIQSDPNASSTSVSDNIRCYSQDASEIVASERIENDPNSVTTNSVKMNPQARDTKWNERVLLVGQNWTLRSHDETQRTDATHILDETSAHLHRGRIAPVNSDSYNELRGSQKREADDLKTENYSTENSKFQHHEATRRYSAWECRGIDHENLVERNQQSRCIIL